VSHIKRINLISIYGFFILTSLLYNLGPYVSNIFEIAIFSLSANINLLNSQFVVVGLSNYAYGIIYLLFHKNIEYIDICKNSAILNINYLFFCVLIFFVTVYFVFDYGWHSFTLASDEQITEGGAGFSIAAYMKYFFVSSYIYYLYRFGINIGALFLLLLHVIVMLIDGGRTTFIPILALSIMIYQVKIRRVDGNASSQIYIYLVGGLLLTILARALVMDIETSLLFNMLSAVLTEASAGSYVVLQTIDAIENGYAYWYTYGLTYLIDPFVWFIPQGDMRNSLLIFQLWVNGISPYLSEKFAPMGGFYYIAEAMAFFPYIGPVIITALFGYGSIVIENNKNRYRLLYLIYFSTFGILFSKAIFGNIFKLFLTLIFFVGLLYLLESLKNAIAELSRKGNFSNRIL
jgi:hypothetical protein